MNATERIIDWFLSSPIHENGAYRAYYSAHSKGPIYPEITAYAISLSCILYMRNKEEKFLETAEACASYMKKISRNGGVPSYSDNRLYAFDTGIFVSGLFDLYATTKKEAYLKEAKRSLDWLYSLWDETQFKAVDPVPQKTEWYDVPSVHLAKLVIPLLKASTYLGEKEHELAAFKLLKKYKTFQTENGSFKLSEDSMVVMSHPQCYATEGFLYAYYFSKNRNFLDVVRKSSDWLTRMQNPNGSLFRSYSLEKATEKRSGQNQPETSDATAQAVRIWKLLGLNQEGIDKANNYLNNELRSNGLRLFKYGSLKGKLFSWLRPVYSWPTFFYLHSLILPFGQVEYCEELF